MSLQAEYNYCKSGQWAERNPLDCPCKGSGWMLSDLDTWHECPIHGFEGMMHPEAEECFDGEVDMGAVYDAEDKLRTEHFRKLYAQIRTETRNEGYSEDFNSDCAAELHDMEFEGEPSAKHWVAAACRVQADYMAWLEAAIQRAEEEQEQDYDDYAEVPYEVNHGPRW